MLVSVIIPNYNYGVYIESAVKSLVNQTHKNLELIIVDDGSTDESLYFIKYLRNVYQKEFKRFEIRYFEKNRGKIAAINEAIPLIRGAFTTILDADDFFHKDYVSFTVGELAEKVRMNKSISLAYSDCFLVDSDENIIGTGKSRIFDKKLISKSSYIPGCAMMTSEALIKSFPFNEQIRIGTKHHMWKKIIDAGGGGTYIEKSLFYYRIHDKNISGIGKKLMVNKSGLYNLPEYWPLQLSSL